MTLKERLDAVWSANEIACPNNLCRWNEKGTGYSRFSEFELFFSKGTLRRPKYKKPKGKGWTWLCRNYGIFYRKVKND